MIPRLKEKYETEVLPALQESLGRKNRLSLPRLEKIVINMGVGSAIQEKKHLEMAVDAMTEITGQKPIITRRKSVAGFACARRCRSAARSRCGGPDVRIPGPLGLAGVAPRPRLPRHQPDRLRRQRELQPGTDEQLVFPELNPDKYLRVQGMNITLVTACASDEEARELLTRLGLPFKREESAAA
jgi:large subunit ribosomal protein L5